MEAKKGFDMIDSSAVTSSRNTLDDTTLVSSKSPGSAVAPAKLTPSNLIAERISAITNTRCVQAEEHIMGDFCGVCRTVLMPWIDALPRAVGDDDQPIRRAPAQSILGRVNLSDDEAIAIVAVVASLDIANKRYDEVEGLVEIMEKFPRAVAAGYRVANIYRHIFKVSTPVHDIPALADIIQTALDDPHRTPEEYIKAVEIELRLTAPLRTLYGSTTTWSGKNATKPSPSETSTLDDLRPNVQGNYTHKPPRGGPWEFVPGTILDKAIAGIPAPHQCFLTRQSKNDPSIKDVRQFPSWATIDWNDPVDIDIFNKWLEQNKGRVKGRIGKHSTVWTQAEKDVLKDAVEAAIVSGKTQRTVDWDEIAQIMFDHFKDITQEKGELLAQSTRLNADNTIDKPKLKNPKKLKEDRVGGIFRAGKTVKVQAMRYGDIALLLRLTGKYKPRGIRADDNNASKSSDASDDSGEDTTDVDGDDEANTETKSAKGGKRRRNEGEDGPSKRRKTPPTPIPAKKFATQLSEIPKFLKEKIKKGTSVSDPPSGYNSPYQ
ncbi:hypothetical protein ONS95_014136 [Cadophora gregata]|uniref:uncharacterized protein n=1 Tax=Cadophora gregata TaxID=51156 RepID=UPI0026DBEE08|nr:uncharacterized protein ONS95_014136 [Cadophora gregata]KAK0113892.1 hypothetical protein ONS96_014743 [Cadophora gregata f. sp. sojae]KAK0114650.1 hypothetical protein ONS95_014136 [Cadophora gregata]